MRHGQEMLVMALALALLLIGGFGGVATAASHAGGAEKKEEKPATEKPAKPAGEKSRRHAGTVKAVDAAGKTLTVEEKSGEATVTITGKTTIKRGKDAVKLEEVKAGDQVTVVYVQQNGKDVARSITVKP